MTKLIKKGLQGIPGIYLYNRDNIPGMSPSNSSTTRIDYWLTPEGQEKSRDILYKAEAKRRADAIRRSLSLIGPTKDNQKLINEAVLNQLTATKNNEYWDATLGAATGFNGVNYNSTALARGGAGLLFNGLMWGLDPVGMAAYTAVENSPRVFNSDETVSGYVDRELGINPLVTGLATYGFGKGAVSATPKLVKRGFTAVDNTARAISPMYDLSRTIGETKLPLELPLNVGWAPKQSIDVVHASNSAKPLQLFYPQRWDVVLELANPFGIWYLGQLGTPRTVETNGLVKGIKAEKARDLFSSRPYQLEGVLTLEKPMQTIGDVPNRSALSYLAERLGADGIIFNGVYDNGYNNNLVILSLKVAEPRNTQLPNFVSRNIDLPESKTLGSLKTLQVIDDLDRFFNAERVFLPENLSLYDIDEFVRRVNLPKPYDANLLFKNYFKHINDLSNDLGMYHAALTPELIYQELPKMARLEEPVSLEGTKVLDFFQKDALPRLLENFKKSNIELTPELVLEVTHLYNNPLEGLDMKFGYTTPGSGGYSQGPNFIRYRWGRPLTEETMAHEIHHSVRDRLGTLMDNWNLDRNWELDPRLISANPAREYHLRHYPRYLPSERETMKNLSMSPTVAKELTPTDEIAATVVGNFRYPIFKFMNTDALYSPKELDAILELVSPEELLEWFTEGKGYTDKILDYLQYKHTLDNIPSYRLWKISLFDGKRPNGMGEEDWNLFLQLKPEDGYGNGFSQELHIVLQRAWNKFKYSDFTLKFSEYLKQASKGIAVTSPGIVGGFSLLLPNNNKKYF